MADQVDMTLMARRLRLDMARRLEESLTKQALDRLIPKELLPKIKRWPRLMIVCSAIRTIPIPRPGSTQVGLATLGAVAVAQSIREASPIEIRWIAFN
jgi:hypothetical protein